MVGYLNVPEKHEIIVDFLREKMLNIQAFVSKNGYGCK
jgi:hypothetical protein